MSRPSSTPCPRIPPPESLSLVRRVRRPQSRRLQITRRQRAERLSLRERVSLRLLRSEPPHGLQSKLQRRRVLLQQRRISSLVGPVMAHAKFSNSLRHFDLFFSNREINAHTHIYASRLYQPSPPLDVRHAAVLLHTIKSPRWFLPRDRLFSLAPTSRATFGGLDAGKPLVPDPGILEHAQPTFERHERRPLSNRAATRIPGPHPYSENIITFQWFIHT